MGAKSKEARREKFIEKYQVKIIVCENCSYKNFKTFVSCLKCRNALNADVDKLSENVFIDIERIHGDLKSSPLSIGLAVLDRNGEVKSKEEIYILPEGEEPRRNNPLCWKVHQMYVERKNGVKVLKKLSGVKGKADPILPSVSLDEAARRFVMFLSSLGSSNLNIIYHGLDHCCLIPFLERTQVMEEFQDVVKHLINTDGFFIKVQSVNGRNYGLKSLVEDWANDDVKEVYSKGSHGAYVDAFCLGWICYCPKLAKRFVEWLAFEEVVLSLDKKKIV